MIRVRGTTIGGYVENDLCFREEGFGSWRSVFRGIFLG